jgi:hypothetical protein
MDPTRVRRVLLAAVDHDGVNPPPLKSLWVLKVRRYRASIAVGPGDFLNRNCLTRPGLP